MPRARRRLKCMKCQVIHLLRQLGYCLGNLNCNLTVYWLKEYYYFKRLESRSLDPFPVLQIHFTDEIIKNLHDEIMKYLF